MFSFQAAFWRKRSIAQLVAPWEDPWRAEHFGSRRAALLGMEFRLLADRDSMPIRYDEAGVLHGGGKWLEPAISRIDLRGVPLDLTATERAKYEEPKHPKLGFLRAEAKALPCKARSWLAIIAAHPLRGAKYFLIGVVDRLRSQIPLPRSVPGASDSEKACC